MAVALAEHFGPRLSSNPAEGSGYDQFIQAMNAQAKQLGMADTGYRNPHGLTATGHVTTSSDMAKLAFAALKQPLFREIVATPQHGCTLESIDGYQRNVIWNNTNRLLGIEGFDGVKTGTTTPAGACLVSSGEREGSRLIVVILGSSSSDSRYVDARNLYRWAWLQLQGDR
jgi:D-alanyl-D-alanine carboxypeptidase (penicillin-binding protein 5/6)